MKSQLFFICFISIFFATCQKKEDIITKPQPIDKYSKNGRMWITIDSVESESCINSPIYPTTTANYYFNYLQLGGSFSCGRDVLKWADVYFEVRNVHKIGTYPLSDSLSGFGYYSQYTDVNLSSKREYRTNPTYEGTIKITKFDVPNRKVSGEFDFVAYNLAGGDTIHLTGKFNNTNMYKEF